MHLGIQLWLYTIGREQWQTSPRDPTTHLTLYTPGPGWDTERAILHFLSTFSRWVIIHSKFLYVECSIDFIRFKPLINVQCWYKYGDYYDHTGPLHTCADYLQHSQWNIHVQSSVLYLCNLDGTIFHHVTLFTPQEPSDATERKCRWSWICDGGWSDALHCITLSDVTVSGHVMWTLLYYHLSQVEG